MFNWSEVHFYRSNFLQNPYFRSGWGFFDIKIYIQTVWLVHNLRGFHVRMVFPLHLSFSCHYRLVFFFSLQNCNLDRGVTSTTFLHNFGTLLTGYLFIKVFLKNIILPSWGIIFSKVPFFLCKFLLGKAISKILK